jgi:glycosyltransferase involved in cell wall biosynthesis
MECVKDPIVSVLMPAYNADKYVDLAVRSILDQTFRDIELVVVDDGSTDRTPQILRDWERRDSRVKLISRPNTGYTRALRDALAIARGSLFARMDADDISRPSRLEQQVRFLTEHPEVVAVGSQVALIDEDGWPIGPATCPLTHKEIEAHLFAGYGAALIHPTVMMRRTAFNAIGGYRSEREPAEDVDLFLRLGEIGQLANVAEVLFDSRFLLQSVSRKRRQEQAFQMYQAQCDAITRRRLEIPMPTPPDSKNSFSEQDANVVFIGGAMQHGNYRTARKYAWRSLRAKPGLGRAVTLFKTYTRGYIEFALPALRRMRYYISGKQQQKDTVGIAK